MIATASLGAVCLLNDALAKPTEAIEATARQAQLKAASEFVDERTAELVEQLNKLNELMAAGVVSRRELLPLKKEIIELHELKQLINGTEPLNADSLALGEEQLAKQLAGHQEELSRDQSLLAGGLITEQQLRLTEERLGLYRYVLDLLAGQRLLSRTEFCTSTRLLGRDYPLTSGYGLRRDPFSGRQSFHAGIDYGAPQGTPVYAPLDGTVSGRIDHTRLPGGRLLRISHRGGLRTEYRHLSKIEVKLGQTIKAGQLIGRVGCSGHRCTGPHLHFALYAAGLLQDPSSCR